MLFQVLVWLLPHSLLRRLHEGLHPLLSQVPQSARDIQGIGVAGLNIFLDVVTAWFEMQIHNLSLTSYLSSVGALNNRV